MDIDARAPATGKFQRSARELPGDPLQASELLFPNYLDLLTVTLALAAARPLPRSGDSDPEDLYGDFA